MSTVNENAGLTPAPRRAPWGILLAGVGAAAAVAFAVGTFLPAAAALSPADRSALTTLRSDDPFAVPELATARETPKPGAPELPRIRPLKGYHTRLRAQRPYLSWEPMPGAVRYEVKIKDPATGAPHSTETVTAPEWRSTDDLPRGKAYEWSVEAFGASGKPFARSDRFRFAVADDAALKSLEGGRTGDEYGLSHAILMARLGFFEDVDLLLTAAERKLSAPDAPSGGEAGKAVGKFRARLEAYRRGPRG